MMVKTRSGTGTVSEGEERSIDNINIDSVTGEQPAPFIDDNDEQETIRQYHERLREQIQEKRMLEDITAMKSELTGETPANLVKIAELFVYHK